MPEFPSAKNYFPELNTFLLHLENSIRKKEITSLPEFEKEALNFFSPNKIKQFETIIPGWQKMASYANGATLTHVISALIALKLAPEYQQATREQRALSEWIVLFHDIEKEIEPGQRDHTHGFRSAAKTATILPPLGFGISYEYPCYINDWVELTTSATTIAPDGETLIQDNRRLSEILSGTTRLFGQNTPAALIVRGVLLHMSVNTIAEWPQAAPLNDEEIKRHIHRDFLPLLELIMLADSDAWSLFDDEVKENQHHEIRSTFQTIRNITHT